MSNAQTKSNLGYLCNLTKKSRDSTFARTQAMNVFVIFANTPTLSFARLATNETLTVVQEQLLQHIEKLNLNEEIKIQVCINENMFITMTQTNLRFSNICVKIEHYDKIKVHKNAILPYRMHMVDAFGEFDIVNSKFGNIRTCSALTYSSIRASQSTADIHTLISHTFEPDSIKHVKVHMMIATKRLGYPIVMQGLKAITWLSDNKNWKGRVRILDEEVGKRQCLNITWFDPLWLQKLALPAIPSQCILNLYRNGLVNVFMAFSPGLNFTVDLERNYMQFLTELVHEVEICT